MRVKSVGQTPLALLSALLFIGSCDAAIRRGYHGRGRNSASSGETCDASGSDGFSGFGKKPAKVLADCTWDFFRCKGSDTCCKQRFDSCCKCVMNPDMCAPATTTTPEPTPPTTTQRPPGDDTTTPPATCMHPSTLIKCIWNFNGCVENRFYPEPTCHACFDECKMIAMGMADPMQCDCLKGDNPPPPPPPEPTTTTRRPITDIDIPQEQELIEAPPAPTPRPITDIDLPEEQQFLTAPEDIEDAGGRRSNNRVGGGTSSPSSWLDNRSALPLRPVHDRRTDRFSAPMVGQQSQLPRPFQFQFRSSYPSVPASAASGWRSPPVYGGYGAYTPVQSGGYGGAYTPVQSSGYGGAYKPVQSGGYGAYTPVQGYYYPTQTTYYK